MARFNKIIDVHFTDTGDFFLGESGDLKDTKNDAYRGFLQRVLTRLQSSKGEWALQPTIGAGVSGMLGKPNTEATGVLIKNLIYTELLADNLLRAAEFVVDTFPINKYVIAFAIIISPPNSGGQVVLTLTYDTRDNRLVPRNI